MASQVMTNLVSTYKQIVRLDTNFRKTSSSKQSESYLETRLILLESYWNKFLHKHDELQKIVSDSDLKENYFTENYYDKTEDLYLELKTLLKENLSACKNQSSTSDTTITPVTKEIRNHTKLPPIQIPTFNGEYKNWSSFKELFTSIIHRDSQLTNIEKLHYLKTSLSGEPETLLKHISLSDCNYEEAWKILEQRFNNPRIIIGNIFRRFLNQRKVLTANPGSLKELIDTTNECLSSLRCQNLNIETWDPLVVHIVVSKLDQDTLKEWEQSLAAKHDLPAFLELRNFIEGRFRALEMVQSVASTSKSLMNNDKEKKHAHIRTFATELNAKCTYCSQSHYLSHCKAFTEIDVSQRREFAYKKGICFNCLIKGHTRKQCRQKTSCRKCPQRHHTLLHTTAMLQESSLASNKPSTSTNAEQIEPTAITTMKTEIINPVILATAKIRVESANGTKYILRALVDQGSQASFVTESAAQLLGLRRTKILGKISGISKGTITSRSLVQLNIQSLYDDEKILINAHVLKSLTNLLPSQPLKINEWPDFENLDLADPDLHKPSPIDILLGAEVHAQIILEGLHKHESLIAQNSTLGWLISGRVNFTTGGQTTSVSVWHTQIIEQQLQRFWEIEEPAHDQKPYTELERECENHFLRSHYRNTDGRYVVSLPFKSEFKNRLGQSHGIAFTRLSQIEQKLNQRKDVEKQYTAFMLEYLTLKHMEEISNDEDISNNVYYLPHHAVFKDSSLTTKLRVVFDGSVKPRTGTSLNEELMIGPPLQQNICDLITRWRQHKICLVADIKQMYRQILIAPEDTDYQRILWRANIDDPVKTYRLRTVTYGTACAPYLAIRTLKQLAEDERINFPEACSVLETDFYMDDLLSGTSTVESTIQLQRQLTALLSRAGFELHKWSTNHEDVLKEIPPHKTRSDQAITITTDSIQALGIHWNPRKDFFELKLFVQPAHESYNKATILSDIARIFDPLGWLGPTVIIAKMFLQRLWLLGLDWRDELPQDLHTEWIEYREQLKNMTPIELPRWLGTSNNDLLELHGFCDASTSAYAAVVYLRLVNNNGDSQTSIVIAKTRVAPVKQISLPRLELCGAVLLAQLIKGVRHSFNIKNENIYAWTDSTIVLSWLRKAPNTWKTFVANRTAEILNVLHCNQFQHIRSQDNPADCASRGLNPDKLKDCYLWWKGPVFLQQSGTMPRNSSNMESTELEMKLKVHLVTNTKENDWHISFLNSYSKLNKLIRVVAYCFRFITPRKEILANYLTCKELNLALLVCIKMSQRIYFATEIDCLVKKRALCKSSKLLTLNPFLDEKGILRVGGRIRNAAIDVDSKHPIVLSYECHLAQLIVENVHVNSALHGGPQITLNLVRRKYWIIRMKNLVKKVVRNCLRCFRQTAVPISQQMGDLPTSRVTPIRAFKRSGVDFAGPVELKLYPGRCKRTSKAYICLFICMFSKAIHLELVSDLSSTAFLAAFRRFTSRRGHCSELWSDQGTNFVGAAKELNRLLKNSEFIPEIVELLVNEETTWHFNPPGSPNFGGLWEAGVKSVKTHLKRVIGSSLLTFEEYATLLCQVEACVNSRPLTPISFSPSDDLPLTPGHFLIGEIPTLISEECAQRSPLTRWKLVQRMLQDLWKRWSQEYLVTLSQRYRWPSKLPEPDVGSVVLVVDDRLPPGKWLLGRIVEKHPGNDGLTRVVTLKIKDKHLQRPINKLCPLPIL